jgi:N6-adenosine-specific RNA methylase IME4
VVNCIHQWIFNVSTKVWVTCTKCGTKFQMPTEATGLRYSGPVPEKYQLTRSSDATQEG